MRNLSFFITLIILAGCSEPARPVEEKDSPLTVELAKCSLTDSMAANDESSKTHLDFKTNFPPGAKIVFTLTENRDAARPPLVRETADTVVVSDSIFQITVASSMLPATLMIAVPEKLQADALARLVEGKTVSGKSEQYCPDAFFCRSYVLDFAQQPISASDSFVVRKTPLEVVFSEWTLK